MSNLITNLIGKFEFESNLIVAELEFEPEPCDIGCSVSLWLRGSSFHGKKPLRDLQQIKHLSAFYTLMLQCCSDYSVNYWISHFVCGVFDKKPLPGYLVFCNRRLDLCSSALFINTWVDLLLSYYFVCKPSLRLRSPLSSFYGILQYWGFSTFWKS